MALLDGVKSFFKGIRAIRSLGDWLSWQNLPKKKDVHFMDIETGYPLMNNEVIPLMDMKVNPMNLFEMMTRDTYVMGLFHQLVSALFKNGYYVDIAVDEDGNPLGNEKTRKEIEDYLKEIEYKKIIHKLINGLWGEGGGNVLYFTSRDDKGRIKHNVEPFLSSGYARVEVLARTDTQEIKKYRVIDINRNVIFELDPELNYLKHLRYSAGGDFRFSTSPSKAAVYFYELKKYIAGADLSVRQNGLQKPTIMTPDYEMLAHLATVMGDNTKLTGADIPAELQNPFLYASSQSERDEPLFREGGGDPRTANKLIRTKMQYKFQTIGYDNKELETIKMLDFCDTEMGYAFRTSKGIISTMDSKYSNAEVERDNMDDLVLNPTKEDIEEFTEESLLPVKFPDYDPNIYPVRFGRDPDQEDLDLYNAKTTRNTARADIIVKFNGVPNYKYNLQTDEIEEIAAPKPTANKDTTPNPEQDVEDKLDSSDMDEIERYYIEKYDPEIRGDINEARDVAYEKFHNTINMNRSELEKWSTSLCSQKVSGDNAPVRRNLELLDTLQKDWTAKHVSWANKTVGFVNRMKGQAKSSKEVKLDDGTSCGTKAHCVLKNWAFDSSKEGEASEYKTKILRDATTTKDKIFSTPDAVKFTKVVYNAMLGQLDAYLKVLGNYKSLQEAQRNLTYDFPPISQYGLNVNTLKQIELKFAQKTYIEEQKNFPKRFKRDGVSDLVKRMFDAKSQLMVKGYESLSDDQKSLVARYFDSPSDPTYTSYKGLDEERMNLVNTLISRAIDAGWTITETILEAKNQFTETYKDQAQRIVDTEMSQCIEATREASYIEEGATRHSWVTVGDSKVREEHREFEQQGWIPLDEPFVSNDGREVQSPASEIYCRCTVEYGFGEEK